MRYAFSAKNVDYIKQKQLLCLVLCIQWTRVSITEYPVK